MTSYPGIMNETYRERFYQKMKTDHPLVSARVQDVNQMVEDLIQDFHCNSNTDRTYLLIQDLEEVFEQLVGIKNNKDMQPQDVESMSQIYKRFSEDKTVQLARHIYFQERPSQDIPKQLPILQKHKLNSFASEHFPVGKPKTRLSPRNKTSPKHGEDNDRFDDGDIETLKHCSPRVETKRLRAMNHTPETSFIDDKSASRFAYEGVKSKVLSELLNTPKLHERSSSDNGIRLEIDELLGKIAHEFNEHRIDSAFKLLKDFRQIKAIDSEDLSYYKNKVLENAPLFSNIETYHKECQDVLKELQDEEGYTVESMKKNFTIKYKAAAGEQVSIKMEGVVDVPLFNMLALIYEMEGYSSWMPFCKEAKEIKKMSRASKACYIKASLPPPVSDREAYAYGIGFDRLNVNGSVLIVSKSIHDDRALCEKFEIDIPAESKQVRMDISYMGGEFYPIGRNKIRINIVSKMNPKIKFVPLVLLNWISRKAAQFYLKNLSKKQPILKEVYGRKRFKKIKNSMDG